MRRPPVTCVSVSVLSPTILIPAFLNGLLIGAVYALVALGLTLVYGVLHIINFAHGALLTAAMFAAYFAYTFGIDPYAAAFLLADDRNQAAPLQPGQHLGHGDLGDPGLLTDLVPGQRSSGKQQVKGGAVVELAQQTWRTRSALHRGPSPRAVAQCRGPCISSSLR